jgi:hypothetical protein
MLSNQSCAHRFVQFLKIGVFFATLANHHQISLQPSNVVGLLRVRQRQSTDDWQHTISNGWFAAGPHDFTDPFYSRPQPQHMPYREKVNNLLRIASAWQQTQ